MLLFVFSTLVIVSGIAIALRAGRLLSAGDYVSLVGELFAPGVLFVIFGVAGLLLQASIFLNHKILFQFGFEMIDLVYAYFIICIAMLCSAYSFSSVYRGLNSPSFQFLQPNRRILCSQNRLLAILLVFDLAVRVYKVKNGLYFDWMRASITMEEGSSSNIFMLIQQFTVPLLLALVTSKCREQRLWLYFLVFYALLIFLEGDRSSLFLGVIVIFLAHLQASGQVFRVASSLKVLIISLCFVVLSSSLIIKAREAYVFDRVYYNKHPTVFLEYLLTDFISDQVFDDGGGGSVKVGSSLNNRLLMWPVEFSGQVNKLMGGRDFMPFDQFVNEISIVVPSILWPGVKPSYRSGSYVASYFNGVIGHHDPATSIYGHIYLFLGLTGVVFFSSLLGALNAVYAGCLIRGFGSFGGLVYIGSLGCIIVTANTYAAALVGIRNQWVIFVGLYVVYLSSRWRFCLVARN